MKKIERILTGVTSICIWALVFVSIFIWNNLFVSTLFIAGIFIWLWAMEKGPNN